MRWPAALLTPRRRAMALFAGVELVLVMAIPFLAIAGYHEVLNSRAGRFVEPPNESEPGWRALVDPSPLVAVAELEGARLTGIALLAGHTDPGTGGTVILVPGTLQLDDEAEGEGEGAGPVGGRRGPTALADRSPREAIAALSRALRLRFTRVEVVNDQRWSAVLGDATYVVSNPDPVVDDAGQRVLAVGMAEVGASNASVFLGRPAAGTDPISLLYRRNLFWSAVVGDPPPTDDPLVSHIEAVHGPAARVVNLPLVEVEPDPSPDLPAIEELVREVIPVPAGATPGDRVRVRILDRTGMADLPAVAAEVASTGSEVTEIGNATAFDGGETELIVPAGVDDPVITDLAMLTGAATVHNSGFDSDAEVTLVIGTDFITGRRS